MGKWMKAWDLEAKFRRENLTPVIFLRVGYIHLSYLINVNESFNQFPSILITRLKEIDG